MEYKGQHINDTEDVNRYEKVYKFTKDYTNKIELGIEELDELKDIIRKKESELKEKGIKFSDVKIEMMGVDNSYNSNGLNDPDEFITSLSWMEEENAEEKEKRIQSEKQRIDKVIEDQIVSEARKERVRMEKIAAAVKVIEENGGTVKNLKI
jgi:translation initiation factor 1 (eIF-1/SUI1)